MSTRSSRNYTQADRALLWAYSGGICSHPDCTTLCVEEATENDRSATTGQIAHIEGLSDEGPRANPELTLQQRNSYPNLILLCGTHHALVDSQSNTYTVAMLRAWKANREARHRDYLTQTMPNITFHELRAVTRALVNGNQYQPSPISTIPPQDKMDRNELTEQSSLLFSIGFLQVRQVEEFVEVTGSYDSTFVGGLISGFTDEYQRLRREGLRGDSLFAGMFRFSAQDGNGPIHDSAGLAVLVYLFERCEVFER